MTLDENKRPEENWTIELIPYALQLHTHQSYGVDLSLSSLIEY